MALQKKDTPKIDFFVPAPLTLVREVRPKKQVRISSPPIDWAKLNPQLFDMQWGACLNTLHRYENEGIFSRDDLMNVFVAYLKIKKYSEEHVSLLRGAPDTLLTFSIVSKAYLLMVGNVDNPAVAQTDRWLTQKLYAIIERLKANSQPQSKAFERSRTIQQAMRDKCSDLIGELQGIEDELGEVNIVEFLKERNVPKAYLDSINERFAPRLAELEEVLTSPDEQLKEAYASYSKVELKAMIQWYEDLLVGIEEYRGVKIASRKPRKRKPITADKLVAKLSYMQKDDDLGITSVDPRKIVGSSYVWLYSTRYRRLIYYTASPTDKTLSVKGASIVGWDEHQSCGRTLRWPDKQLAEFMKLSGKAAWLRYFKNLTTKDAPVKGRLTDEILILKVG